MNFSTRTLPQGGSALIVAIIFLLLLSTLALAGLRSSTTNVQIVGNMQARQEAQAAAQMLLEQLISRSEFATNPAGVRAANPQVGTDFNGDGNVESTAALVNGTPACLAVRPLSVQQLDPDNAVDAPCFKSSSIADPGIVNPAAMPSLCADTEWLLTARGTDARSGSSVTISQGATARREAVGADAICNN